MYVRHAGGHFNMPRFILTADWHLRDKKPRCRLDADWYKTQREQLEFISTQSTERGSHITGSLPIVICGDIFNQAKVSDYLKNMFLDIFEFHDVCFIAGNHDLHPFTLSNIEHTSFWTLTFANRDDLDRFGEYKDYGGVLHGDKTGLLFLHELVFEEKAPFQSPAKTADQLLDEYPDVKWIFVGDNHQSFHYRKDDRHVISPGCLNRQSSDMQLYTPCIWDIDTDKNIAIMIPIPDDVNMITDDYMIRKKEKNNNISSFVETVKNKGTINLDFIEQVKNKIKLNEISDNIQKIIYELIEV
jgi:DNA repair exonuclease SbcCD nuclease subunit